jgi:hypothetical protein
MLDGERWLWQRGAVWLVLAPAVLTLLVYVAIPWVDPSLEERSRTQSALAIGFGTAMCFNAIFLLGVVQGQLGDAGRTDRIWLYSHALATFAIGLGAALLGSFGEFGSAVSSVGMILLVGGVIVRVAGMLVRWIARPVR